MRHLEHQIVHFLPYAIALLILSQAFLRTRRRRRGRYSSTYRNYIGSPQWGKVRQRALRRAGHRCEHRGLLFRCPRRYGLQVHHKHYRYLEHEWDGVRTHGESLVVLCRKHHALADARRRRRVFQRGRVPRAG